MGTVVLFLFVFTGAVVVHSSPLTQVQLDSMANAMTIRAEMMYNLRENEKAHTVRIYVHNGGNTDISASGWRLFFHSIYILYPDIFPENKSVVLEPERVRVGMVQGDLYYLDPTSGFKEIRPKETRTYDITAAYWSVARTDFMPNWYLTSENDFIEARVVNSTNTLDLLYVDHFDDVRQWKRFAADRYNPFTAQERMRRLSVTDKGKIGKLVIPTPLLVQTADVGSTLIVNDSWKISQDKEYTEVAVYLSDLLNIEIATAPVVQTTPRVIFLRKTNSSTVAESYKIEINATESIIILDSHDENGMFYAVQTLRSILEGYNRTGIPGITILDAPRYHYRGMHIDVARNFHSISVIKRLMKVMAMYKMNRLHLHLSDDEGWRLEIPGLPELTQVGSQRCYDLMERKCIIPQFGSGPSTTTAGSGFFSMDDYKALLQFAKTHHIQVIPEFDMPGHAHAAIISMEERYRKYHEAGNEIEAGKYRLSDPNDASEYISVQQWMDNAVNPCINSTYAFIGKVMDEVITLHRDIQPLEIYNFGGDEVATGAWEKSPLCIEFATKNPIYKGREGIKLHFVEEVSKLAAERNLSLGGCEDGFADNHHIPISLEKLATTDAYAIPWNNIWELGGGSQAYKLANYGYKVILAQATNIYFDQPQEPDPEERGLYWATRFTDTYKVLKFMPDSLYDNIFEERSGKPVTKYDICGGQNMYKCEPLQKPENIIGIQGKMWSETVRTSENVDYMMFPRLLALAERAWHKADFEADNISSVEREERFSRDWQAFANTLGYKELRRLDDMGVQYRVPPPGARVKENGGVEVSTTYPGLGIQHSYDGGRSWSNAPVGQEILWREGHSLHLRTVSSNWARYSRPVQLFKVEPLQWSDQPLVDYIGDNVDVHVAAIDNLEKDNKHARVKMELRNNGTTNIPAGTWRIYFYSLYGGRTEDLQCGLSLRHENGSLYYVTPTNSVFPGIAAGETLTCQYHNINWIVSRTDNMPNWYVTSLGMSPKQIKSTHSESLDYVGKFDTPAKWKRAKEDRYDPYTPAERYDQNVKSGSKQRPYKIVPTPSNITRDGSSSVVFNSAEWVVMNSTEFTFEVAYLADKLNISIINTQPNEKFITFVKANPTDPDSYSLYIDATLKKVTIISQYASGALHGAQSCISLIEGSNGHLIHMTITDKPRYSYRGVMLDIARNFKPKEWILEFLDVMSMYKLNKLHLHLTDDESWRVEIPKIPELIEIASQRCHSDYKGICVIPQLGSGPDKSTSGSGFYSIEDYRDILKYANDRHIEIIPEIDIPGHSSAAIAAMAFRERKIAKLKEHGSQNIPESFLLSNNVGKSAVFSNQRWTRNSIDPCLNTSYTFVETVIDGLVNLHQPVQPLKVFHLGGDEVPTGVWDDSQDCTDMLGPGKLIDTQELKRMFMKRVADIVAAKNLNIAACDDGMYTDDKPNPISDYGPKEVYAYTWDNRGVNTKRPSEFANAGYKVVLLLATHLYFDQRQEPDPEERGLYWATGFIDTRKTFGLMPDDLYANIDVDHMGNPIDVGTLCGHKQCPMPNNTDNIIGIQACIWAETMRTRDQFHYMAFPRLLALAERAWHKASWEDIRDVKQRHAQRDSDWTEFADTLGYKELPRLEQNNVSYRVPPPGARVVDGVLKANTKYANQIIESSKDNGHTWTVFRETRLGTGSNTMLLRSKSSTSDIYSRPIQVTSQISPTMSGVKGAFSAITPILALSMFTFLAAIIVLLNFY